MPSPPAGFRHRAIDLTLIKRTTRRAGEGVSGWVYSETVHTGTQVANSWHWVGLCPIRMRVVIELEWGRRVKSAENGKMGGRCNVKNRRVLNIFNIFVGKRRGN